MWFRIKEDSFFFFKKNEKRRRYNFKNILGPSDSLGRATSLLL